MISPSSARSHLAIGFSVSLIGFDSRLVGPYIFGMASKRVPAPREVVKVRRLPAKGDKIQLTAEVTRTGRNGFDTADTITIRIPGYGIPITVSADLLLGEDDEG